MLLIIKEYFYINIKNFIKNETIYINSIKKNLKYLLILYTDY